MKELENYLDARKKLCKAVGIDEVDSIEDYRDFKFCNYKTHIVWLMNDEEYSSDIVRGQLKKKSGLILALFSSDFDSSTYWAVFDCKNELSKKSFDKLADKLLENQ